MNLVKSILRSAFFFFLLLLAKLRQLVFSVFKMAKKMCLLDFQESKFQKNLGKIRQIFCIGF